MYDQILIATDGSPEGELAVNQGLSLAKAHKSKVIVLTVTQPYVMDGARSMGARLESEVHEKADAFDADKILTAALYRAKNAEVACEMLHAKNSSPAIAITETASARGCDLIVIGSHGKNTIARFFQGSTTMDVVARSSVPVLVCR